MTIQVIPRHNASNERLFLRTSAVTTVRTLVRSYFRACSLSRSLATAKLTLDTRRSNIYFRNSATKPSVITSTNKPMASTLTLAGRGMPTAPST